MCIRDRAVVLAILSFSVFHITALGVLLSVVTAALAALLVWITSVSYTHLDVYKRQDKARALHYVRQLNRYHMAGFETIFYPENFR